MESEQLGAKDMHGDFIRKNTYYMIPGNPVGVVACFLFDNPE
jgi:hypothetical protein